MTQFPARLRLVFALLTWVCVLVWAGTSAAQTRSGLWTAIGPGPGRVDDVLVNPVDPATMYVVSDVFGYVYKTSDAGATWRLLDVPASGLAMSASDPRIMYAAGASNSGRNLYRSADGGDTWTLTAAPLSAPITVDPSDPLTVYGHVPFAPPTGRLRRTTDGGMTWTDIGVSDPRTQVPNLASYQLYLGRVVADPLNPATLYVSSSLSIYTWGCEWTCGQVYDDVYRSTDRGSTWQTIPRAPSPLADVLTVRVGDRWERGLDSNNVQYSGWIVTRRQSATPVALSASFTASTTLPSGTNVISVGPTALYAGTTCAGQNRSTCTGFYRSADGGATWAPVRGVYGSFAFVAIAPSDPRRIYAHTGGVSYQTSSDAGLTWSETPRISANSTTRQLYVDATEPSTLYAAASEYTLVRLKSTNAGLSWSSLQGDLPASCAADSWTGRGALFVDPMRSGFLYTFCGGVSRGVYRTQDGGSHWARWGNLESLLPTDLTDVLIPPALSSVQLFIDPAQSLTLYASVTWSAVLKHPTIPNASTSISRTLMARSMDGENFTALERIPGTVEWDAPIDMAFDYARPGVVYALAYTGNAAAKGVFKSVDAGVSWTALGASADYQDIVTHPGLSGVFVTVPASGVTWIDDGGTWIPLGLPSAYMLLAPSPAAPLYAVVAGAGIWRLTEPCTSVRVSSTAIAGAAGGRRSVRIEPSTPTCLWSVSPASVSPWITLIGQRSGVGPGSITFEVAPQATGTDRIGTIAIGDTSVVVEQRGYAGDPHGLDFNGDGRADLFAIDRTSGEWTVYFSNGTGGFTVGSRGGWLPTWTILPADFNGDGLSDFLLYHPVNGLWYRAISNGLGGFSYSNGGWRPQLMPYAVHLDRDALSDVLLYDAQTGEFWTAHSINGGAGFEYTAGGWAPGWDITPLRQPDGSDDLLLYNAAGTFYTVSNLGSHKDPSQPASYQGGGWRGGWSRIERDGQVLLYDPQNGDSIQTIHTREVHPFYYWDYVRWPSGLRVLPGRGFRSAELPEYLLYAPASGLYYVAAGLPSEAFVYYVGQWPANRDTFVADFTGDGRDDVLLYEAPTGAFALASNRGAGGDGNWAGFELAAGVLGAGLDLIVSKSTPARD